MLSRHQQLNDAPLDDLLAILLRQFKALLAPVEIGNPQTLARQMVAGDVPDSEAEALRERLVELVRESEAVLAGWNLSFAESLITEMDAVPGWETTADFLELANEKSNAELRIAAGSTLLAASGDLRFTPHLLAAIATNPDEIETVAARRLLSQHSGIAQDALDWQEQVEAWWQNQQSGNSHV